MSKLISCNRENKYKEKMKEFGLQKETGGPKQHTGAF